uniref:Receptor ligand binding region domain-containing protein n=1 Tax=Romanomermis culicivorax TaxID=13658 RepID=A0A915HG74_ROMCU
SPKYNFRRLDIIGLSRSRRNAGVLTFAVVENEYYSATIIVEHERSVDMFLELFLLICVSFWLLTKPGDALVHRSSASNRTIAVGIIFPRTTAYFADRLFTRRFKAEQPQQQYNFANYFTFRKIIANLSEVAFPMDTIRVLCDQMVKEQVVAIIYLAHWETYGRSSASIQYLIHMASYTGIPIIAWNADNSAHLTDTLFQLPHKQILRRHCIIQFHCHSSVPEKNQDCSSGNSFGADAAYDSNLGKYRLLQLAPSLRHQVEAMIQILIRYDWKKFAVITSMIAGKNFFVQLCMSIAAKQNHIMQLDMVTSLHLNTENQTSVEEDFVGLSKSEARIFLFYATSLEAKVIFALADKAGLTGSKFMWIATQSVVGTEKTIT